MTSAGINSLFRKSIRYQWKIGWSIPQKGTGIGCLGARDDQIIRISNFFWWKEAVEVIEAIEVVEVAEVIEAAEVLRHGKPLLRTSELSRHLSSALFLCFEKKKICIESLNIIMNFCTFSVGGCWGQVMSFFWKLVYKTQMCNPPEATRHHNLIKLLTLLPCRAI